jgi:hypothetical protein
MIKILLVALLSMSDALAGEVVVIGNTALGKLDVLTIQKLFTGKLIRVNDIDVTAVNIKSGALRDQFLSRYLNLSDEKYSAYWAIRLFAGKGMPPKELQSAAEVIIFVKTTTGAIGYINEDDLIPEVRVVARPPGH